MIENDVLDDDPCESCPDADWCDPWEAQFCCTLCQHHGGGSEEDCEKCDKFDI